MDDRRPNFVTPIARINRMTGLSGGETDRHWQTDGRNCYISIVRCRSYCLCWNTVIVVYFETNKYLLLLMQNLASKILCIFVTGGAYAPYAPCLSTPLPLSLTVSEIFNVICYATVAVTLLRHINKGQGHSFWYLSISHMRLPIGCQ